MPVHTEAMLAILDLYGRYNHYFDDGEADLWAGLFTPDATFNVRAGNGDPLFHLCGTAQLAEYNRKRHVEEYSQRKIRHLVSNIVVDFSNTGTRGIAYVTVLRVGNGLPPQITNTGRYVDELTKDAEGWRFRSRIFKRDL